MKLIIFSDIHYMNERPINPDICLQRKLTQYAIPLLEKLISKINNEYCPDLVINLGDLIEDSYRHNKMNFSHKQDIINLKYVYNKLKKIKFPFYSLMGNHDLRTMESTEEVKKIIGYKKTSFSIDVKGYHLVFLNPEIDTEKSFDQGGILRAQCISKQDIKWLDEDLKFNRLPCIIFTHFGIAEDSMEGNFWFANESESAFFANRKEIKTVLNNKNVIGVFSGHQHWTKTIQENKINYYIIGSLTENINNDNKPDGVYFEVNLNNRNIEIIEHHISIDEDML